jgi:hypothetical protein
LKSKGDFNQQQMAEKWHDLVSRFLIGKALKKIGFTRKKNIQIPGEK